MDCMKCGKELKTEGVFCSECLAEMEKYPVKPNISVQLPVRRDTPTTRRKSRRQRYVKAEEQIRHLKKVRNWLIAMLITVILLFAGATVTAFHYLDVDEGLGLGQNYSTSERN